MDQIMVVIWSGFILCDSSCIKIRSSW